jgi:hypothetical protein
MIYPTRNIGIALFATLAATGAGTIAKLVPAFAVYNNQQNAQYAYNFNCQQFRSELQSTTFMLLAVHNQQSQMGGLSS